MQNKLLIGLMMLLLLMSCNRAKSPKWLEKNTDKIREAAAADAFFIPKPSLLEDKLQQLEQYEKNLASINTSKLSEEEQRNWQALTQEVQNAIRSHRSYLSSAENYRLTLFLNPLADSADMKWDAINTILAQSDSFYFYAKTNLADTVVAVDDNLIQSYADDFFWLSEKGENLINNRSVASALQTDLQKNIQKTQLEMKDFIGFLNSIKVNND